MRLSCRIRSGGSISWDVSGIPVTRESDKYQISVIETGDQLISQLTLTTDESDFVSYGCSAVNEMGSDYARIELVVNGNDCQYLKDNKMLLILQRLSSMKSSGTSSLEFWSF